jgi:hypothetical protein
LVPRSAGLTLSGWSSTASNTRSSAPMSSSPTWVSASVRAGRSRELTHCTSVLTGCPPSAPTVYRRGGHYGTAGDVPNLPRWVMHSSRSRLLTAPGGRVDSYGRTQPGPRVSPLNGSSPVGYTGRARNSGRHGRVELVPPRLASSSGWIPWAARSRSHPLTADSG